MSLPKIIILSVLAVLVAVAAFSVFNSLSGEVAPLSAAVIADGQAVESKIEAAASDTSAFYVELSDEELSALHLYKVGLVSPVRDIAVSIHPDAIDVSGGLGNTPSVPFSGEISVKFIDGLVELEARNMAVPFLPVPGAVKDELQPLIDQGMDINEALGKSGDVLIQRFEMQTGKVIIIGVQRSGVSVSTLTASSLLEAIQSAGQQAAPVPPGGDTVPPGSAGLAENGAHVYLALGDSLASNIGVRLPQEGYVSRFHSHLEKETGRDLGLINLGISGESSVSFKQGQFQQAVEEISSRKADGDSATKVSVVTLNLGANDLLPHLGSTECQLDHRGAGCQARINAGLEVFGEEFPKIVEKISEAINDDAEFYIMTMYNPFDFGLGIPLEDFSNEVVPS